MEEIKAGDIMVGNYLMFEQTTHIVVEVSETLIATRCIKGSDKYIHTFSELKPIPLTEDVLLKCGFGKSNSQFFNEYQLKISDILLTVMKTVEGKFFFIPSIHVRWSVELTSLHELQNLVRCLTKKELIVEL